MWLNGIAPYHVHQDYQWIIHDTRAYFVIERYWISVCVFFLRRVWEWQPNLCAKRQNQGHKSPIIVKRNVIMVSEGWVCSSQLFARYLWLRADHLSWPFCHFNAHLCSKLHMDMDTTFCLSSRHRKAGTEWSGNIAKRPSCPRQGRTKCDLCGQRWQNNLK